MASTVSNIIGEYVQNVNRKLFLAKATKLDLFIDIYKCKCSCKCT